MERTLGSTRLVVSRLGLGLAALGRPGYVNLGHALDLEHRYEPDAMKRRTHEVLDAARAAGIRYFDAARSYGRAEEFLGSWLADRAVPAEEVTVGSKWGYAYTAGWRVDAEVHEVKQHSLAVLRRQLAESRALLGEHLDLYQIHSATLESGVLDRHDVLEEVGRIRDGGLAVGLTLSGVGQGETLRRALEIEIAGRRLFDCVQATWNLLETSAGAALAEASAAGLGVIVKEGLANGRLTPRNRETDFAAKRRVLEDIAASVGASLDAVGLAGVMAQPWADIVLSGAATVEQLRSNLHALDVHLEPAVADRLLALREEPDEYWAKRARLAWN